jgi:opacity protein-like surface antigen
VPYVTAGVGYAWADFDRSVRGTVGGIDISVGGDSGFTANAGFGVKYFATERLMVRFDARYRYIDALADRYDSSLNTFETTLGIDWRF